MMGFWMMGRCQLMLFMVLSLAMPVAMGANVPDSLKLEKELQNLSWPRFRSVVESIPRLKAEVDSRTN